MVCLTTLFPPLAEATVEAAVAEEVAAAAAAVAEIDTVKKFYNGLEKKKRKKGKTHAA